MKTLKALPEAAANSTPLRPSSRLRRLRRTNKLRAMVRETNLTPDDFILPLFVEEKIEDRTPIKSMPGIFRETEKSCAVAVKKAEADGLNAVILFGIAHKKDTRGNDAMKKGGLLDRMISAAKNASPEMTVIADLCFCEYTDHGHCGVLDECGDVDNDATLENLQRQAVIAAEAGADIIAPSGMMDGAVAAIRSALDESGFPHIAIMSYSTKFASCFYGPFRDAAGCSLGKGNRKTYQ
ncbi:MAG: porphobilinogen synthase, partial [Proteobacteria bacterium]|nr:porphobilinogen synthase [Pseudomonadota bacterium]